MPIYEYECDGCGRTFEFMQSMSEAPKTTCEECGGKLEKRISAAGFILKGGGWYKDLYSSPKPGGSSSGSDKGGDGGGGGSGGGESKPEKKDSASSTSSGSGTASSGGTEKKSGTEKKK
jgi:putative FmdB family regulatory protein